MQPAAPRRRPGRRGVTLVEMMVTVALVILIMTIIVAVFRSATAAMRGSQIGHDMDQALRRVDATIRQDLVGATARFTPPLNPRDNLGYFEYGENAFADLQGEDSDDYMALTVKAPEGQPFTGRFYVTATSPSAPSNGSIQPITITSEFAEVLYFLRNGNLYRRVLLIVPERQAAVLAPSLSGIPAYSLGGFSSSGTPNWMVSWRGVYDVSARPTGYSNAGTLSPPTLNTLGDLTNRENRIYRQRFSDDFNPKDGMPDDGNSDGIPDFYPTLFPNAFLAGNSGLFNVPARPPAWGSATLDILAFPFVFPGAYSKTDATMNGSSSAYGLLHGMINNTPNSFNIANRLPNHSPLEQGDNLAVPVGSASSPAQFQTYWGWPTWKETLSTNWTDPVIPVNYQQRQSAGMSWGTVTPLPPMTAAYRTTEQPYNDGAGSTAWFNGSNAALWANSWEDDLLMTGVRSFDIKAFDAVAGAYVDLGGTPPNTANYTAGNFAVGQSPHGPPYSPTEYQVAGQILQSFQHEGRIPPLQEDLRTDPQWPARNVGEDSGTTVRLRRVWDSWSTEYTNAPGVPYDPTLGPPFQPPAYPSYPPPYPAALRGIQIQLRIVNHPDADRVRVLTIRQDFTDKL